MSAEVQSVPEIKSIDRVYQIPIVHDSVAAIHSTLTTYTPTAYAYGQALTTSAYSLSTPIQTRLAPLIVSADGYALKGLDAAQAKFPTPFSIKTEEVVEGIKTRKDSAVSAVTQPVYALDSSLAPIVDRIEGAINKFNHTPEGSESSTTSASSAEQQQLQVARLLGLRHTIYTISSEQLKSLQTHNVYIQSASEKLTNLNDNLSAYYSSTKDKSIALATETRQQASVLTGNILQELEKIQAATLELPKQVQLKLQPVQEGIQSSLAEISSIVKSEAPVGEKVTKVGTHVQERVQPLLEQTTQTLQAYIAEAKTYVGIGAAKATEVASEATPNGTTESS